MAADFCQRKQRILRQLALPEAAYDDRSPKGSIDEGIRALIDEINAINGLVTTSSCSGRVSAFLEGKKKHNFRRTDGVEALASPGGKGGGRWIFVSHEPVDMGEGRRLLSLFGLRDKSCQPQDHPFESRSFVHLKFEPMILHLLTASLEDAQRVVAAALQAGFRESGAVGLSPNQSGTVCPMVAVRSIGLAFDSIIGYQDDDGSVTAMVDEVYLRSLVSLANERFHVNAARIQRFRETLLGSYAQRSQGIANPTALQRTKPGDHSWEDPEARKMRKKIEGLRRQEALKSNDHVQPESSSLVGSGTFELSTMFD